MLFQPQYVRDYRRMVRSLACSAIGAAMERAVEDCAGLGVLQAERWEAE